MDNITVIIVEIIGERRKARRKVAARTKITAFLILLFLVVLIGGAAWGGMTYLHHTAYLAESEQGTVAVYRGVPGSVLGFSYSELVENTDVPVEKLPLSAAESISSENGMRVSSVEEALELVKSYQEEIAAASKTSSAASSAASSAGADAASGVSADSGSEEAASSDASSDQASSASGGQG